RELNCCYNMNRMGDMIMNILIVDDDSNIRELLQFHLQREAYKVYEAEDGESALDMLEVENIHLAIVDVMMPGKNGYEVCKEIREYYDIPVIMLTAKGQLVDKEKGFSVGTDDYLVKPFEPQELLFRMKALLRRYQMTNPEDVTFGDVVINMKSYEVKVAGSTMLLPLKEFQLLAQLASHPGRIFTREQLIEFIWGIDFEGDERTVDVHIKR